MICSICSSTSVRVQKPYLAKSPFFTGKSISKCDICGMQFACPMPSSKDWEEYNSSYFLSAHGGVNSSHQFELFSVGLAKVRFRALSEFVAVNSISLNTILEVGPGAGYLAREILTHFPNVTYYVIETDKVVHHKLNEIGTHIICEKDIYKVGPVDFMIATHVLEHTLKPIEFLNYYSEPVRYGGGVFIEVPCLDHLYKNFYEPHIQFFEKETLEDCFNRIGLRNIHLTYNGDKVKFIRIFSFLRKVLAKLEDLTGFPFHWFLGKYWPNMPRFSLLKSEALAILETAPHVQQDSYARWLRGFGLK